MPVRIAVTGAAGFVGGAVVAAARARGWPVHAFARADWDLTSGPLPDPPPVDAVVHAAARVADRGRHADAYAGNVTATRNVVASFPGVRLVHVSTASVYDPFTPSVAVREVQAPVVRYLNPYAATKAAAERELIGRPDTVVLRPHAVYGPGDRTLLPRLLGAARAGVLVLPGDRRVRHTLTAIATLVDATLLACDTGAPPGVYNVGDAEPVVLADLVRDLFALRGAAVRLVHVPAGTAWAAAAAAERVVPVDVPLRLTRYAVSQLGHERTLDLTAARTRLGLRPRPTSLAGAAGW